MSDNLGIGFSPSYLSLFPTTLLSNDPASSDEGLGFLLNPFSEAGDSVDEITTEEEITNLLNIDTSTQPPKKRRVDPTLFSLVQRIITVARQHWPTARELQEQLKMNSTSLYRWSSGERAISFGNLRKLGDGVQKIAPELTEEVDAFLSQQPTSHTAKSKAVKPKRRERDPQLSLLAIRFIDKAKEEWTLLQFANMLKLPRQTIENWHTQQENISFTDLYAMKEVIETIDTALAQEIENLLPSPRYDLNAIDRLQTQLGGISDVAIGQRALIAPRIINAWRHGNELITLPQQYLLKKAFGNPQEAEETARTLHSSRKRKRGIDSDLSPLTTRVFETARAHNWSLIELARKIHMQRDSLRKWRNSPGSISFQNLYRLKDAIQEVNPDLAEEIEKLLPHPPYDANAIKRLQNKTSLSDTALAKEIHAHPRIFSEGAPLNVEYQYRLKKIFGNPPQDLAHVR